MKREKVATGADHAGQWQQLRLIKTPEILPWLRTRHCNDSTGTLLKNGLYTVYIYIVLFILIL